jgi:N-acetylmuramic acid 6-phosphate (MurNAc-6-P) etherase
VVIGKSILSFLLKSFIFLNYFSALVTSIEAIEDDPIEGAAELQRVTESFEHVLFIGITCGISAPFVGGQLEYCLDNPQKFTPVLIGFNPISMARKIRVPKWPDNRTFHDIATRMENTLEALVLNPIVGPEPISGSSRMKGGTATKIILDTAFYLASTSNNKKASEVVEEFKTSVDRMEIVHQDLATVVQQAGEW